MSWLFQAKSFTREKTITDDITKDIILAVKTEKELKSVEQHEDMIALLDMTAEHVSNDTKTKWTNAGIVIYDIRNNEHVFVSGKGETAFLANSSAQKKEIKQLQKSVKICWSMKCQIFFYVEQFYVFIDYILLFYVYCKYMCISTSNIKLVRLSYMN